MTQKPVRMIAVAPIAALLLVGFGVYLGKRTAAPAGLDDPQVQNMAAPKPAAPKPAAPEPAAPRPVAQQAPLPPPAAVAPAANPAPQRPLPPPPAAAPDPQAKAKAAATAALTGTWTCEGTAMGINYTDTASYLDTGDFTSRMLIHSIRPGTLLRWGRWKFETGSDLSRNVTRSTPTGAIEPATVLNFQLHGEGRATIGEENCRKVG